MQHGEMILSQINKRCQTSSIRVLLRIGNTNLKSVTRISRLQYSQSVPSPFCTSDVLVYNYCEPSYVDCRGQLLLQGDYASMWFRAIAYMNKLKARKVLAP